MTSVPQDFELLRTALATYRQELSGLTEDMRAFEAMSASALSTTVSQTRLLSTEARRMNTALGNAFSDVILKGEEVGEVLSSLALKLADIALDKTFSAEGGVGSVLTDLMSNLIPSAKGNVFSNGSLKAFARGGIINSPVAFPLSQGIGLAGEAGSEAILPLARGADGRLGVRSGSGGGSTITLNITTPDANSFLRSQGQVASMMARLSSRAARNN